MQTVCRSTKMAEQVAEFINDHNAMLVEASGVEYPNALRVWVYGERRIENKITALRGWGRVIGEAVHRWAAMQVGRRQKSFPFNGYNRVKLDELVPYNICGESWPVFGPSQYEVRERAVTDDRLKDFLVKANGMHLHPEMATLHVGNLNPSYKAMAKQLTAFARDLCGTTDYFRELEKIHKPWIDKAVLPLEAAMTKLDEAWNGPRGI